MSLTITQARQNLFALADAAARGERVAERKVSNLSPLTPIAVLAEGVTLDSLASDLKDL